MEKYFTIVSDGSCDLPEEIVKEKEIGEVHFLVSFDGKEYSGGVQCFSADSGTVSK